MNTLYLWLGFPLLAVASWLLYWYPHARKFQTSGYEPPATSWFGQTVFYAFGWLVGILTVGPIKVVGKDNVPENEHVIFVANHQVPSDFALVRRATGRHFRALGAASQFPGFLGLIAAFVGIISVTYDCKKDKAAAEAAGVKIMSAPIRGAQISGTMLLLVLALLGAAFISSLWQGWTIAAIGAVSIACLFMGLRCADGALAIAPQGALMPDNELKKCEFRPGAVRIGQKAAAATGMPIKIVPMAIHYKRSAQDKHWSHYLLAKTRSAFPALRNPRYWDDAFKVNLDELCPAQRAVVEQERREKMRAYKRTKITSYGGVVVVGDPIDVQTLPQDPIEAMEEIRLKIAALLEEAKKH